MGSEMCIRDRRCVAMSLCALIYSKITKITSVDDMTQIMIVGIQLYPSLSLLARQSMLMLTELSGMVTVFEHFFQLEYRDSYICNIHGDPRIEVYHYCICHSLNSGITMDVTNITVTVFKVEKVLKHCNHSWQFC